MHDFTLKTTNNCSFILYSQCFLFVFLLRRAIDVIGFSSDGDPRLLSSMGYFTLQNELNIGSSATTESFLCLQDTVHIGTKLRNRLLAPSIHLPLGSSIVTISHLKLLINRYPKEEHGLVLYDICPEDRQNFGSLQKIMQERVLGCLTKNIMGSAGTVRYLRVCAAITSSLIEESLKPEERIYKMCYSQFFVRAWKVWLLQNNFTIKENFITNNAFTCIEINAQNLISLTKKFRNGKIEELFMPSLFNSQPNEELFRQLRSMGTINYTKINFTLLELFHTVSRVELLNNIIYIELAGKGVFFPRNQLNKARLNQHKLPSDEDIDTIINKAKLAALKDAVELGMRVEAHEIETTDVLQKYECNAPIQLHIDGESVAESDGDDGMPDQSDKNTYIDVTLADGTEKKMKKSTYLWTLKGTANHLSNDRLKRVQGESSSGGPKAKRQLVFRKENHTESLLTLAQNTDIQIGEWCIFKDEKSSKNSFLLGNIVAYRYINGHTAKQKQYSWEIAPIEPPANLKHKRGIEVLAAWYLITANMNFSLIGESRFININRYVGTLDCPHLKITSDTCLTITSDKIALNTFFERLVQIASANTKLKQ